MANEGDRAGYNIEGVYALGKDTLGNYAGVELNNDGRVLVDTGLDAHIGAMGSDLVEIRDRLERIEKKLGNKFDGMQLEF